jgi:hypothetical protein
VFTQNSLVDRCTLKAEAAESGYLSFEVPKDVRLSLKEIQDLLQGIQITECRSLDPKMRVFFQVPRNEEEALGFQEALNRIHELQERRIEAKRSRYKGFA